MLKRTISLVLFWGGVVLQILSLNADMLGIGEGNMFGWKQWIGVAVGLVALVCAYWLGRGKPEQKK
jgi:hypothetical protein